MLPVGGRPLIEHTIAHLARYGVREIFINLHHRPEVVQDYFGDGRRHGVSIEYSVETELLGTAGAVRQMANSLRDRSFFVVYGDNLTTCDLDRLVHAHHEGRGAATVALFWKEDVTPHSSVALETNDRITRFVEKPTAEEAPSHWISAGVNVVEPVVLDLIPAEGASDFGFDLFPRLLREGQRIQGYRMGSGEGLWWIDTPEHYRRVRESWADGTAPIARRVQ
jgi:NDP-sugar pyrophosphorylase family protein